MDHQKCAKRDHKKCESLFKYHHHLKGLFLVVFLLSVLYLIQDTSYSDFISIQIINTKKAQIIAEKSSSSSISAGCDYFSGRWIYDNRSYPLYEEKKCSFMWYGFACELYGRKDLKFRHWRWQPHNCDIPRFNGTAFLEKLRGKKLLFVGDSLNRNQWLSLLCMIESSLPQLTNKTLTLTGSLNFLYIMEYNTTIGFYWSPFLVESNCDDAWHHQLGVKIIRVQSIENHARHWMDADILIFNSFAWWFDPQVLMMWGSFGSPDAIYKKGTDLGMLLRRYEMTLATWSDWLEININHTKTNLFFMGFSPYIYRGDALRTCYNVSEPISEEEIHRDNTTRSMMKIAESTLEMLERRGVKIKYIPITRLSEYRRDAHPSIYRRFDTVITQENRKNPITYGDCLHWCLPGVPDIWNQILSAYIMIKN